MATQMNKESMVQPIEKLGQDARKVASQAASQFDGVLENSREFLNDAGSKVAHGYDVARKQTTEVAHQVEGFVKKYPFVAVGAAAGLGWILGRALKASTPSKPSSRIEP
jgi:ElaB/YqjD/DUF883 family membrane-anchored ribosome-binding protein